MASSIKVPKTQTKKMAAITGAATLELRVTKTAGPLATAAEVGSTGNDDHSFTDGQLTPGPVTMPLNPANTYAIVWSGAFVRAGSATLIVRVLMPDGTQKERKPVRVNGKKGDVFIRVVLLP